MSNNNYDQAVRLRTLQANLPTKVISITGGKGGVGKTNLTLGLAGALAKQGQKVMVLDADLGLANVDVLLGLRAEQNLSHVLQGDCELNQIIIDGPHGMKIIPAASGLVQMAELSDIEHAGIIQAFTALEQDIDVLLIDTAAGISNMVTRFCHAAQQVLVVVCDEPTSITDAYALIKILSKQHQVSHFKIVANMVQSYQDGRNLFMKLQRVTERFLNANLELVACIPMDEHLRHAVKQQRLIIDCYPKSPITLALNALATKASQWPVSNHTDGHMAFFIEKLFRSSNRPGDILCD